MTILLVRAFAVGLAGAIAMTPPSSLANPAKTQVRIRGGKMAMRMENGKIALTELQGEVGGGRVQMTGNVGASQANANVADIKFDDVPLSHAAKFVKLPNVPQWLLDMGVSGSVKAQWQGKSLASVSHTISGSVNLQSGPGKIADKQALSSLEKLLRISNLPELEYKSMTLQAHASNGVLVVEQFTIEGPEFKMAVEGDYSAVKDNLDIKINLAVSRELAKLSSYMKWASAMDWFGNDAQIPAERLVAVPQLQVSGAIKQPDVRIGEAKTAALLSPQRDETAEMPKSKSPLVAINLSARR